MSGLEKSLFQLKFTAKQLTRQAAKAGKEEQAEKNKVKKALTQGNTEVAQLYAQNAIRKANEKLNLIKLSSRIDSVASRIQTAVTMRAVSGNMIGVIKGMDKALQTMNLEKIALVMDKFEQQFEDLDSSTQYYESVTNDINVSNQPQEEVDLLMSKIADEAGLELKQNFNDTNVKNLEELPKVKTSEEDDDKLTERLRALRN
ncbi:hypothetical protein PACTADRAFT_72112 [Pachysolen tannophilus NRRL Y-2460]|uniref:Vacuolar protein-sorting-associated protein 46 n=1 Tax=Pachysolen tannophilus NRRL Y-2460 TaxID=669874 RepID=A0A1E4TQD9_PACTA|nr:hypothetical protein PACTADRAFT_72112 [Pachysolen tannophilus NRRL Y-2460]